ncbi:MAG: outer membrane beta-barrel protein [Bacteroidales bacterium]|nr:outer membrane beta-barrel protein [Bacteroidales bacterium]
MKKLRLLFAMGTLLLTWTAVQAKGYFGVRGGINVSQVSLDKGVFSGDNRCGFFLGPTFEFSLPVMGLGMDVALLYDLKTAKMAQEDGTTLTEKFNYVDCPLNLRYTIGSDKIVSFSMHTGPQLSLTLGNTRVFDGNYSLDQTMLSWNVGASFRLFTHYQFGYNYNVGVGRTAEFIGDKALGDLMGRKFDNNTHQITLTYYF